MIDRYRRDLKIDITRFKKAEELLTLCCHQCGLTFFSGMGAADDSFYSQISRYPWYYEDAKVEFNFARDLAKRLQPRRLLEIGAGKGVFLDMVRSVGKIEVWALELNPEARVVLQDKGIPCIDSLKDMQFDMICCFQTLEHIEAPGSFLQACFDALPLGGHFFASVPNPASPYFLEVLDILDYPPHHLTRWSEASFEQVSQLFPVKFSEYFVEEIDTKDLTILLKELALKEFGILRKLAGLPLKLVMPKLAARLLPHVKMLPGHTHGALWQRI